MDGESAATHLRKDDTVYLFPAIDLKPLCLSPWKLQFEFYFCYQYKNLNAFDYLWEFSAVQCSVMKNLIHAPELAGGI